MDIVHSAGSARDYRHCGYLKKEGIITNAMPSIERQEQELFEIEAQIEGLRDSLESNKAKDLVKLIVPTGKMKGEITGLTRQQYRGMIGREPSPRLLAKLEGQTTEKIPWHLALDQLATERGYSSDEELKEAIQDARSDTEELEGLKRSRDALISDIKAKVQKGILDVDTIKVTRESDLPNGMLKGELTEVNGSEIGAYRQHSFWSIEVDLDNDGVIDHKFRIRYAKEARKLIAMAIKDIQRKRGLALKGKKVSQYKPRRRASKPRPRMIPKRPGISK